MIPFNATLSVERDAVTKDAIGASVRAWTARLSNVPCCVYPVSAATRQQFAEREMVAQNQVLTEVDLSLDERDRIVIGGQYHQSIGYEPFSHPMFGSVFETITGTRRQNH